MDQFHLVSTAFLELGKTLVIIFAHLPEMKFNILSYMVFQLFLFISILDPIIISTLGFISNFLPIMFITLGKLECLLFIVKACDQFHLEVSLRINICELQFVLFSLSGISRFEYRTVVACCWCGGNQSHASFKVTMVLNVHDSEKLSIVCVL